MICQALATLKIKGPDGAVRELPAGQIFTPANPDAIRPMIERGKVKVIESAAVRSLGLDDALDAILLTERDNVIRLGRWQPTEETRRIEAEIDRIYLNDSQGAKLLDFTDACKRWRESGTGEDPAKPGK